MMKKLFDKFLDKPDPLVPIRLVSPHLRLLGIISISESVARMVLIDYDNEKST